MISPRYHRPRQPTMTRPRLVVAAPPDPEEPPTPPPTGAAFRSSVTQTIRVSSVVQTFTFTFAKPYWTGRFVTGQDGGDWWVIPLSADGVEPHVTIVSVSPAWTGAANGSYTDIDWMEFQAKQPFANPPCNPISIAGNLWYNDAMRLKFTDPVNVVPNATRGGTTIVHSKTKDGPITSTSVHGTANHLAKPFSLCFAVLTVLPSEPPAGSFRPTWAKATKTLHNISSVRKSLLAARLAAPGQDRHGTPLEAPPALSEILTQISSPWVDYVGKQAGTTLTAAGDKRQYHGPCLFGDQGHDPNDLNIYTARGYLRVLLDWSAAEEATRDAVIYNLIQIGIDYFGWLQTGTTWGMTTGHQGSGFVFPIYWAGLLLNFAPILSVIADSSAFPGTSIPAKFVRFQELMKTHSIDEDIRLSGYNGVLYPPNAPITQQKKWPELIPTPVPTSTYKGAVFNRIIQCDQRYGILAGPNIKYNAANWWAYITQGTNDSWIGHILGLLIVAERNPTVDARAIFGHEPIFLFSDDYQERLVARAGLSPSQRSQSTFIRQMWDTFRSTHATKYPIFTQSNLPLS